MKSFETDLKKYAQKVRLKASERRDLRDRLLSYMEYHPLPKQGARTEVVPERFLETESFTVLRITRKTVQLAAGLFTLVIVALPVAAERAVPGEVLYFVKTGINEPVQARFVGTPYEKIEFETKLIERRIAEARTLKSQGKLTDEVEVQLAETVKDHTRAVTEHIAEIRTQDVDGAAIAQIAFGSSLEVQSAVLSASEAVDMEHPDALSVAMQDARGQISGTGEEAQPSYESLLAQVEQKIAQADTLFASIKESAKDNEVRDLERRLSDARRVIGEAKESHGTANAAAGTMNTMVLMHVRTADTSGQDLVRTLGTLQKLITFMTDINVRESVQLDALVPVVLSDEERLAAVEEELAVLTAQVRDISARIKDRGASPVTEKITQGLSQAELLIESTSLALQAFDATVAEAQNAELRALTKDLVALTETSNTSPIETPEPVLEADATTTTDTLPEATENR